MDKNAKVNFEEDLLELLKKYGIEYKQPIKSISIVTEVNSVPRIEIDSMIVDLK